jgi:hypothetical protein
LLHLPPSRLRLLDLRRPPLPLAAATLTDQDILCASAGGMPPDIALNVP